MSSMEFFIGRFEELDRSELTIEPADTDDFYDEEERLGYHIVKVDDKLFKFWSATDKDLDEFGFATTIPQQDGPLLVLYWYNGGAGLHEVAEEAIRRALEKNQS